MMPVSADSLEYAFRLTAANGDVVASRSYSPTSVFNWIPLSDGSYTLTSDVKNLTTGEMQEQQTVVQVVSDAGFAPQPRIMPTTHPLVAVYSTTCVAGQVSVLYYPSGGSPSEAQATPSKQCQPGKRVAFVIGGMKAQTEYVFQDQVVNGSNSTVSGTTKFTTGELPAGLQIVTARVESPQTAATSTGENVTLQSYLGRNPLAFDNQGNVIWYYRDPDMPMFVLRPVTGGTMFVNASTEITLREIDLAGNILHELTAAEASDQLAAMGLPPVLNFNHDAVRLPNGYTAALAAVAQQADQGSGPVTVVGDMVLVLDRNWNIVWLWNPFDKLDTTRGATLDDKTCLQYSSTCPGAGGNDWTHANSLQYLADGNLLVSIRAQDWIVKIDYRDGAGTGDVLWRLGRGGDFTTDSPDPYPWFSHQHFATLLNGELTVYDNGNTRIMDNGGNSRGQVWQIDEKARTAHLALNVDLGGFSVALGSAQRLANGDYEFLSGWLLGGKGFRSEAVEVAQDGTPNFKWTSPGLTYRIFRMPDLYTPENVQ